MYTMVLALTQPNKPPNVIYIMCFGDLSASEATKRYAYNGFGVFSVSTSSNVMYIMLLVCFERQNAPNVMHVLVFAFYKCRRPPNVMYIMVLEFCQCRKSPNVMHIMFFVVF